MFLKVSVAKKLFKEAYDTCGLRVAREKQMTEDGPYESYIIAGSWWIIEFVASHMPKEIKAAVINLTGELPELGKTYCARKGEPLQYELQGTIPSARETSEHSDTEFTVSKILEERVTGSIRFLYTTHPKSKETYTRLMSERIFDLIDISGVDNENGEEFPAGPYGTSIDTSTMVWRNNRCILCAYVHSLEETKNGTFYSSIGRLIKENKK